MLHCMPGGVGWGTCLRRTAHRACTFYIVAPIQDYCMDQRFRSRAPPTLFPHPYIWLRVRSTSRTNSPRKSAVFSFTGMRRKLKAEARAEWEGSETNAPDMTNYMLRTIVLFICKRLTLTDVPQLRLPTGLHPKCACFDLTAVTDRILCYLWHINCAVAKLPGTCDA